MNSKQFVVLLVVLLIVSSGVGWFLANKSVVPAGNEGMNKQVPVQSSEEQVTPMVVNVAEQKKAIEESNNVLAMQMESGVDGTAEVTKVDQGTKTLYAFKATLPELSESNYYEIWVVDPADEGDAQSLGQLRLVDGMYQANTTSPFPADQYKMVWITREKNDDLRPEVKVAEGTFNQ